MNRVLAELCKFQEKPDPGAVHDLRVALRRCRAVAAAVQEVDPHRDWQELRDRAKKLFRSLGDLRDAQVMADWIKELQPDEDVLKQRMLAGLSESEDAAQHMALHRAKKFHEKRWRALDRSLTSRLRRIPLDGDAARCLALERLEEAKELHRRALRTENPRAWHALRIGIKRFRYTVESLLPTAHEEWSEALKRVQDALGNLHDLDVLKEIIEKNSGTEPAATAEEWVARIDRARQENLQDYRQMALGSASIWQKWLGGFPRKQWPVYANARIDTMRKAMDRKPGHSQVIARLAKRLAAQLVRAGACESCGEASFRRPLEAAARLSGIRIAEAGGRREKAARKFLLDSALPPTWRREDWERVAWSLRFKRGPAPGEKNKRFSRLPAEQRAAIAQMAGILRLANALRKCGVTAGSALRMEAVPPGLLLHVVAGGVTSREDSPEQAAHMEKAKALLETSLGKTIVIRVEPADEKRESSQDAARGPQLVPLMA